MKEQNLVLRNKGAELNSNRRRMFCIAWCQESQLLRVDKKCTCLKLFPSVLALPLLDNEFKQRNSN